MWDANCSPSYCQKPWESSERSFIVTLPCTWVNRLAMARADRIFLVLHAPSVGQRSQTGWRTIIKDCHVLITESANTICSYGGKEGEWCWWCCFFGIEAQSKLCTTWSRRVTVLLWEWSKKPSAIISVSWGLFSRIKSQVVLYSYYNGVFHLCPEKRQSLICPIKNVQHPMVFLWHLKVSVVTLHYPG